MKTKLTLRMTDLKKGISGEAKVSKDGDWTVNFDNGETVTLTAKERDEPLHPKGHPLQRRYAVHN